MEKITSRPESATVREVLYLGDPGSFSHQVGEHLFGVGSDLLQPVPTIQELISKLDREPDALAVLPIENTSAGIIYPTTNAVRARELIIMREVHMDISHSLLGFVEKPDDVREALSHPMALKQVQDYLKRHGIQEVAADSTAAAAETVASDSLEFRAAIGPANLAAKFADKGLKVIDQDIQDHEYNVTRFFLVRARTAETEITPDHLDPRDYTPARAVLFISPVPKLVEILEVFYRGGADPTGAIGYDTDYMNGQGYCFVELLCSPAGLRKIVAHKKLRQSNIEILGLFPSPERIQSA